MVSQRSTNANKNKPSRDNAKTAISNRANFGRTNSRINTKEVSRSKVYLKIKTNPSYPKQAGNRKRQIAETGQENSKGNTLPKRNAQSGLSIAKKRRSTRPEVKRLKNATNPSKKKLALLLPAHNEGLIIEATINSAIAAGQKPQDIYVVDDNSTDETRRDAVKLLGRSHVLTVQRSGKALAVNKALKKFEIEKRYKWVHIADADSVFSPRYFKIYKSNLNEKKYAIAVGFVQSMRGNWLSNYRSVTYTYSQHVNRRVQSYLGMISVFPGPITSFRTDVLKELDFDANSLTEDFDITLQVHRKKLGKIKFIPKAINYTQDPQTLSDFWKQNLRWQRGFFQGVKKYKIGLNIKAIDASIGFQMFQTGFYLLEMFVLIPIIIITTGNWMVLPVVLAADFLVTAVIAIGSSAVTKRWTLLGALPYFYFLRWLEIAIFMTAFVEIMILRKFRHESKGWSTEGRRYKLSDEALRDTAG